LYYVSSAIIFQKVFLAFWLHSAIFSIKEFFYGQQVELNFYTVSDSRRGLARVSAITGGGKVFDFGGWPSGTIG